MFTVLLFGVWLCDYVRIHGCVLVLAWFIWLCVDLDWRLSDTVNSVVFYFVIGQCYLVVFVVV